MCSEAGSEGGSEGCAKLGIINIRRLLWRKIRWGLLFLLLLAKVKSTPSPRPKTGV